MSVASASAGSLLVLKEKAISSPPSDSSPHLAKRSDASAGPTHEINGINSRPAMMDEEQEEQPRPSA
jgi:hypothetical protein